MNLLALPIDIQSAMYVEGGLEASLYISRADRRAIKEGKAELDFIGQSPVGIPNALGIVSR